MQIGQKNCPSREGPLCTSNSRTPWTLASQPGTPPIVHNTHCTVNSSFPKRQERRKEMRGMMKFKTIMTVLCISLNFLFTTFCYDNKNQCLGERGFFFFFFPSTSRISCLVESRNDLYYPSLVSFLARHASGLIISSW